MAIFFQDNSNLEWQQVYFFYRNGIVLESYVETKTGTLESVTNFSKSRWGVFTINSDTFSFEKCYPSSGGGLPAYMQSDEISNDTTFVIHERYRLKGDKKKKVKTKNETYHFRKFTPKPNCTNSFVK